MTKDQRAKIESLAGCIFQVASFDKRFVRSLSSFSQDRELTEKQALTLEQMYHRYRRQIKGHEAICQVCKGAVKPSTHPRYDQIAEDRDRLDRWLQK